MTDYTLKNEDPDDISDLLIKVEKLFNIKFGHNELIYITTFGELCDHITNKIQLEHSKDCTSQQAFYKLRDAIAQIVQIDNKTISTAHSLTLLFPKPGRRKKIKDLEKHLGIQLNILQPPYWITITLVIILLFSFVYLFFNWRLGLPGIAFSIGGLWLSDKTGEELDEQTVGEAAKKMIMENYLKSRRNPQTFNRDEIENLLTDLFSDALCLDKSLLTREAKFEE